uniref:Uncharacterized protein n=1 Tax=Ditylenchus dipsaci TaxID=166011 RepID=A0A915DM16_9BILA
MLICQRIKGGSRQTPSSCSLVNNLYAHLLSSLPPPTTMICMHAGGWQAGTCAPPSNLLVMLFYYLCVYYISVPGHDYLEAEPSAGNLASSSSSVASRLYLNGTQRSSRRNSFSSEPDEVSNQMSSLTKKLTEMQEMQMATNEEKSRLRTENAVLQERVHLLEEQFQASEQVHSRFEREKQLEAESGSLRCQILEKDLNAVTKERDRLEESSRETQQKLRSCATNFWTFNTNVRDMRLRRNKSNQSLKGTEGMPLTDGEQLRDHSSLHHQGSLTDQIILLEDEIERLRLDNRELREQNMDLQAQILHDQVECGREPVGRCPSITGCRTH